MKTKYKLTKAEHGHICLLIRVSQGNRLYNEYCFSGLIKENILDELKPFCMMYLFHFQHYSSSFPEIDQVSLSIIIIGSTNRFGSWEDSLSLATSITVDWTTEDPMNFLSQVITILTSALPLGAHTNITGHCLHTVFNKIFLLIRK